MWKKQSHSVLFIVFSDLFDAGYVGYTRGHLRNPVKGHEHQSYAIAKHYKTVHGKMPQDMQSVSKYLRTFAPKSSHTQIFLKLWLQVENDKIRLKT